MSYRLTVRAGKPPREYDDLEIWKSTTLYRAMSLTPSARKHWWDNQKALMGDAPPELAASVSAFVELLIACPTLDTRAVLKKAGLING